MFLTVALLNLIARRTSEGSHFIKTHLCSLYRDVGPSPDRDSDARPGKNCSRNGF